VSDIEVKMTEPETVVYVPMSGAYDQVPEALGRLYGWVAQHGLQPAGMPSAVYLTDPATVPVANARWEVCAPVVGGAAPAPVDEAGCGIRDDGPQLVASLMFRGPYEEMGPAYADLFAWTAANGYTVVGPPKEVYFSDPSSTPATEYLTEIRFPVAKI